MKTDTILHKIGKLKTMLLLLLMVTMGVGTAWGQVDYSGTYYFGVFGTLSSSGYNSSTPATSYYMCPTEDWIYYNATDNFTTTNNGQPFLTSFPCKGTVYDDSNKAVWSVVKSGNYYKIIHAGDGKYLVANGKINTSTSANRLRVHLQDTDPGDLALFTIAPTVKTEAQYAGYLTISPKNYSGWYLNIHQGNQQSLQGTNTEKNDGPNYNNRWVGGTIGVWSEDINTSMFFFENYISAPTFTYNESDNNVTISNAKTVNYTMTDDGTEPSDPTTASSEYTTTISTPDEKLYIIKAVYSFTIGSGTTICYSKVSRFVVDRRLDTNPDYSGFCYLQNQSNTGHYLYPSTAAADKDADGDPYVTTATQQALAAVWQLVKVDGTGAHYIRHFSDGKYLVAKNSSALEKTVTLVATDDPASLGNQALFVITETSAGSGIFNIMPKDASNTDDKNFLNPIGGVGKIIGLFTADAPASKWKMTTVPAKPTFARNDNRVTITTAFGDARYVLDNLDTTEDDDSDPTATNGTKSKNVKLKYGPPYQLKAVAFYDNQTYEPKGFWTSEITTQNYQLALLKPVISTSGNTLSVGNGQEGVKCKYYYSTTDDVVNLKTTGTEYSDPIALDYGHTYYVKAIAFNTVAGKTYYSEQASFVVNMNTVTYIDDLSGITDNTGNYVFSDHFSDSGSIPSGIGTAANPFKGRIDGNMKTVTLSGAPLFECIENATIKNILISANSSVSTSGNAGAIACVAKGATRIYNCGMLGGTVNGSDYVGSLVGSLEGTSRVINCFSNADITGGSDKGGIVGYNQVSTNKNNLATMVMNCMFYGNIEEGGNVSPIYGGLSISNKDANGVGNYNYFRAEADYVQSNHINVYNCALMAETRYLQRFEFFRHLLNSNRALAAWWATGSRDNKDEMKKWVMEPSQIGTDMPYPILKNPGKYSSVVNIDTDNAPTTSPRNKGGKLGTLSVHIQMGSGGAVYSPPTGATITTSDTTLVITDKDPDHFNFNYYKVQLPYYNEVGSKNYNDNLVVTGWKIVDIGGGTAGSYDTGSDVEYNTNGVITKMPYNFADRDCTDKDLYSVSGRIFNQGAYFDVPEGVSSITIEPYWAKAVYLSDAYPDVVYNTDMNASYDAITVGGGRRYDNNVNYSINESSQKVYTSMSNAISSSALFSGVDANSHTVYDYAVVLVGNYHQITTPEASNSKPYTVTSVDLDGDNEPDYSFILRFNGRTAFHPVRYDFLNIVGLGMAQKSTGGNGSYNLGIMQPKDWFEVTNTALFRVTQFEYSPQTRSNTNKKPIILQGGIIEQWVSLQNEPGDRVSYFHVGGNVWFKEFHLGTHQDNTNKTPHPPVSVTGGDFEKFYLTGAYRADAANYVDDAECYINGGRFGTVAGAGMEGIGDESTHAKGNVTWQIDHADIDEFYGGGINASKPVQGNINTTIKNSHVGIFCGGPKFGDMIKTNTITRTVKTTATDCVFGTYYGAGYGGNSYGRRAPMNYSSIKGNAIYGYGNIDWNGWVNGTATDIPQEKDKTRFEGYDHQYSNNSAYTGVAVGIDYQFLPMSDNSSNVARLFVDYVKFSLATTYDVTSTLTGCEVTGNFYGGGNLGKVDGPVTSTLTNCTVHGSVFGAGFSASLPPVEVLNTGGFATPPRYDPNLGVYLKATPLETVTYTWEHQDVVNSKESAINETDHFLYTQENLSPTNLGSVSGAVTLTIQTNGNGESVIGTTGDTTTGNVYGGGDASSVNNTTSPATASTTVNIKGNTRVLGNVFGGGNNGMVSGNAEVNIEN